MDAVHKQEFRVRDLPTRSVTLFPTRAQVVRDIKDVSLKPGTNQITVVGFSPTVDESSIKVEGTGSAIISDIAVELLPNREIFQDIYPETDDDDKSDTEDEDEASDDDTEPAELKEVRSKIRALRDEAARAAEVVSSAESRLKILEAYGKSLDRKRGTEIDAGVETYRTERAKVFQDHLEGTIKSRELAEAVAELEKEEVRWVLKQRKADQKAARARARDKKAKQKEKQKVLRRLDEALKEKKRVQREREKYWPRKCYTVRITLDAPSFTPSTSRRSSIASVTELAKPVPEAAAGDKADGGDSAEGGSGPTCDLSIAYVTSSAFWSPAYDLQLSTTSNTASLCFDAQLTNTTSESWTGCKVILSTSQTTFSGLNDIIPTLVPWRVKLVKGYGNDSILTSREEAAHKASWHATQNALVANQQPRSELFGVGGPGGFGGINERLIGKMATRGGPQDYANNPWGGNQAPPMPQQMPQMPQMPQFQQMQQRAMFGAPAASIPPPAPAPIASAAFGAPAPVASAFGAMASASVKKSKESARGGRGGMGLGMGGATRNRRIISGEEDEDDGESESEGGGGGGGGFGAQFDDDGRTVLPEPSAELEFQESSFEETGMTTTYDLPGLKTLAPSSTSSKQRVARISFQNVVFSHTIVAKYKPVAYLKARLKNASKLTLLKGPAGLTLDGSFMGRATLPRCSAGDTFPLSLGVDPAIRVAYPKPDVKRATTGIFSKEDSSAYRRSVTIANTRASAGKPVTLVVLDQVPVSEDEKLRVELQQPRGLAVGGAPVAAGVGMTTSAPGSKPAAATATTSAAAAGAKDWGTATATLKKAGEIVWDVKLNAGRTVKLDLEYDVSAPTGEGVVQC